MYLHFGMEIENWSRRDQFKLEILVILMQNTQPSGKWGNDLVNQ